MKRRLEQVPIPGEEPARERAWKVVRSAFAEREPRPRRSPLPRVAAVAVALAAVLGAALSAPGRAVVDELRELVGVERAQRALFSLPAQGRLLVSSDAGMWVVGADGSKRLLGPYREASWSPFGRFVVAARADELAALEPDGDVRWTLARPGVRSPRWAGTETDTRIAYADRTGLRVVAGDGTGDRLLVPRARGSLAWRPRASFVLAYATARRVRVVDAETGAPRWQAPRPRGPVRALEWSADGRRLLLASARGIAVYGPRGARLYTLGPGAAPVTAAALAPHGRSLVFAQQARGRSEAWVVPAIRPDASSARRLLSGAGTLAGVAWSPDARWVVVEWPTADQLVFLRASGAGIRAVANVAEQFRTRSFPRVDGWCCPR
ncbi:MAG TPA: hypothetical protein VNJ53_02655 [Gaiellaceae bacterium]|nr:hypothetical protein [Gaiellaceae bacterium]